MTIDATVAGAASNSYLTVAEATALAADDIGPEAERWLDGTVAVEQHEAALKRATRDVDDHVRPGSTVHTATQRLLFPRATDLDAAGDPIIPPRIRNATYYQAIFVLANAAVIDRANARQARNASQASEPNTSYTQADDPSALLSRRALQALATDAKAERGGGMRAVWGDSGFADPAYETVVL